MINFALQVTAASARGEWLETARKAEANGFYALACPHHPGAFPDPFVALAAAAAVTSTIRLAAHVVNAGVYEPMALASAVATLDILSGGRVYLGVGTGHNPAEWDAVGMTMPDVRGRVDRCIAVAEATQRLLAGEEVTRDTLDLRMTAARLASPSPIQQKVPLLIGGANPRLLGWAAAHADELAFPWLGRRWTLDQIDARLGPLRSRPIESMVHTFEVTDDAEPVFEKLGHHYGLDVDEVRQMPYVLVGSVEEIAASIRQHERRWAITRYGVRATALDHLPALRAVLHS
ncbi:LLM class flavin-dependent oxidoreductase [Actinoplanes sp. M2I2]|uniref:LLM class flavin-dependent oxidoreductase n=1 Tax=Actinoplanes sp. M2I2 TaxID=1734444 RepID=UPI002021A3A8|nr:LLM class flavin-dependent oxidoreductase [Actinoplanes sp. M2I2]